MEKTVGQTTLSREQLLDAAGLLVEYARAEGDRLYMDDGDGGEVEVLDLVGGFGSSLLGHHHPEIRRVVESCLDAKRPVHAQGSRRRFASELKRALADYLLRHTGRDYTVCLLNTGTEAVEAALKHAHYAWSKRVQRRADAFAANVRALRAHLERGEVQIDERFLRACEPLVGQEPLEDLDELLAALASHNQRVFNTEPFIAGFEHAFHGKTRGSLAVTWNRDARLPFLRHNRQAAFITDPASFIDTIEQRSLDYFEFGFAPLRLERRRLVILSAVIYEPIRGEGGVRDLEPAAQKLLRDVHERYADVALIADEVQCGLGRTGRPVESQALGLPNDYLTFAKSLGGGIAKVSALAVRADRYVPEFDMLHTSTFADDDLSSAVGRRVLEIIERDALAARCATIGAVFAEQLRALQQRWPRVVKSVRGRGCMLGIELHDLSNHPSAVLSGLAEERMLGMLCAGYLLHHHRVRVLPATGSRDVLRVQPSAYLQECDVRRATDALDDLFSRLDGAQVAVLVAHIAGHGAAVPALDGAPHAPHPLRTTSVGALPAERVGFISHLIHADSIREWDPSIAGFNDEQLAELREQMHGALEPRTIARRRIRSPLGREIEFILYGVLMDSEAVHNDMRFNKADVIRRHVRTAYGKARHDGCGLVGFGGYTSIVTANCCEFDDDQPAVTTGNALTVAASIASMRRAAASRDIELARAHLAIVGAAGNIGEIHAALLGQECGSLSLLGRAGSKSRLRAVAHMLARELCDGDANVPPGELKTAMLHEFGRRVAVSGGSDPELHDDVLEWLLATGSLRLIDTPQALSNADIVICASNSPTPFLDTNCFAGAKPVLICDVSVPGDVDQGSVAERPNLKLIRGGVVNLPHMADFELPGMLLGPGQAYACVAETMLLGLAGVRTSFSKGRIRSTQVREVEALARLHGFELDREKLVSGF